MSSVPGLIAALFEYALVAVGLGILAWLFFRPAGKRFRARPPALRRWDATLTDLLFLAWLMILIGIAGQIALRLTAGNVFLRLPQGTMLEVMAYSSMLDVAAIATGLIGRAYFRRTRANAGWMIPPILPARRINPVWGGLAAFLVSMPLLTAASLIWTPLLKALGLPIAPQKLIGFFAHAREPVVLVPMILLAIVVAPMAEEIVFRAGIFRYLRSGPPLAVLVGAVFAAPVLYFAGDGFLELLHGHPPAAVDPIALAAGIVLVAWLGYRLDGVRRVLRRPTPRWMAFVVSAGIFALAHANWASFLPLFVLGLIFAAAYEYTGIIAVSMLAHALFNLNTLLLVFTGHT